MAEVSKISTTPIDNVGKMNTVPRANMASVAGITVPAQGGGSPPAVPTIRDYQFTANDPGNEDNEITLVAPGDIVAGDLLLLIVGSDTDQGPEWNAVSGWTLIDQSGDNSVNVCIGAYWKEAVGGDGNVTVTQTNIDDLCGWYISIAGADTTSPIHKKNFQTGATTNNPNVPGVTTTEDYCLAILGLMSDGADMYPYSYSGTGWSKVDENGTTGGSSTTVGGTWGTKDMASSGGTVNATVGCSVSDGASYFQIAILPA
jgi:hypothetical protein